MPPLLVIPALPRPPEGSREALPELPALSELLRLADGEHTDAGWRDGLMRDLGFAGSLPEAVVAASALGVGEGSAVCLAAPVHAVAGMHRVHLHAAGVLRLDADERAELAQGFAAQFGPEIALREAGSQWLLECRFAQAADDTDPLDWLGAPLERRVANSAEQKQLRRLGAEIEMWLADLPLNTRRRGRGRLPVNLLWLWGGGLVPAQVARPGSQSVVLHGVAEDAWLAGCARLAGAAFAPLPEAWPDAAAAGSVLVLPAFADAGQLVEHDSRWFAPALQALRNGRVESLRLRAGGHRYHVRHGRMRRLLRRRRPWWQAVES